VSDATNAGAAGAADGARGGRARFGAEEFAIFNTELAAACSRDVPLPSALRVLKSELRDATVRDALDAVARDVEGGADLASAFERRRDVFSPTYVALVRAGLRSGDLPGTLLLFAEESRFTAQLRNNVRAAIVYPALVLFAASLFLAFAGWVLLPGFEGTILDMAGGSYRHMGTLTRMVFALAPVLRFAPAIVLALAVVVGVVWKTLAAGSPRAVSVARFVLGIPLLGRYVQAISLTRFSRLLAAALAAEIPVPEALALAGIASGNAAVRDAARELSERVGGGASIAESLEKDARIFPATLVWMLSLGESRGDVVSALEEYARIQGDRCRRLAEILPTVLSTIVVVTGTIMLSVGVQAVFGPLIGIMRAIGSAE